MYAWAYRILKNDADTQDAVQNALITLAGQLSDLPEDEEKLAAYIYIPRRADSHSARLQAPPEQSDSSILPASAVELQYPGLQAPASHAWHKNPHSPASHRSGFPRA